MILLTLVAYYLTVVSPRRTHRRLLGKHNLQVKKTIINVLLQWLEVSKTALAPTVFGSQYVDTAVVRIQVLMCQKSTQETIITVLLDSGSQEHDYVLCSTLVEYSNNIANVMQFFCKSYHYIISSSRHCLYWRPQVGLDWIKLLKCIEGGVGPGLKSCGLRWVTFIAAEV